MDFLKDPPFSQYRNTTTMTKYFPINSTAQENLCQNFIYQALKFTGQPSKLEQQNNYKEAKKKRQNVRVSSLRITEVKFLSNKTSQRLKTISNMFDFQGLNNRDKRNANKINKQSKVNLKKQNLQFNTLNVQAEKFHKSVERDKDKIQVLKKYNHLVDSHYDRFQINEDRTRKQIQQHQQIIKLLAEGDVKKEFITKDRKSRQSRNSFKKNAENLVLQNSLLLDQSVRKSSSMFILSEQKVSELTSTVHCEDRISRVLQQYARNKRSSRRLKTSNSDKKEPSNISSFEDCPRPNTSHHQANKKGTRFLKQYMQRNNLNKQNRFLWDSLPQKKGPIRQIEAGQQDEIFLGKTLDGNLDQKESLNFNVKNSPNHNSNEGKRILKGKSCSFFKKQHINRPPIKQKQSIFRELKTEADEKHKLPQQHFIIHDVNKTQYDDQDFSDQNQNTGTYQPQH